MKTKTAKISDLLGKTLVAVNVSARKDAVELVTKCGKTYQMNGEHECDIAGDVDSLVGSPLVECTEHAPSNVSATILDMSSWTSYKMLVVTIYELATADSYVRIRWLGESPHDQAELVRIA